MTSKIKCISYCIGKKTQMLLQHLKVIFVCYILKVIWFQKFPTWMIKYWLLEEYINNIILLEEYTCEYHKLIEMWNSEGNSVPLNIVCVGTQGVQVNSILVFLCWNSLMPTVRDTFITCYSLSLSPKSIYGQRKIQNWPDGIIPSDFGSQ